MLFPHSFDWLTLPNSRLRVSLQARPAKQPLIVVEGNPRGMVSLANVLLWMTNSPSDAESLSITSLPFIAVDSALALNVILVPETQIDPTKLGQVIRSDKAMQYDWRITEDGLVDIARLSHGIGCNPEAEYFDVYTSSDSDAEITFRLTSYEQ